MKLRILEVTLKNGDKRYRIQRQWFWFLWLTYNNLDNFVELEDAQETMKFILRSKNKSVVQKNIICGGDVVGGDIIKLEIKESKCCKIESNRHVTIIHCANENEYMSLTSEQIALAHLVCYDMYNDQIAIVKSKHHRIPMYCTYKEFYDLLKDIV